MADRRHFGSPALIRSLLIVPAGDPAAIEDALAAQADALILDLRSAPTGALSRAAEALRDAGRSTDRPRLLVRINPLDATTTAADLAALCPLRPDGVMLPRAETAADVQHLGAMLSVEEAKAGFEDGAIRIVALAETGSALFGLNLLGRASRRLDALAWDGEALARDLGADAAREPDGRWCDPCQTARTLTLAASADARLPAIDSIFSASEPDAFRREAEAARRDGFSAKLARDAGQVAIVNQVFAASI